MSDSNLLFKDNLITLTNNLANVHLTLAVEALLLAKHRIHYNQFPLSVLLHGFCAIESAINFIAHEHFENKASPFYIAEANRDFPLKRMIKTWSYSISILDKIEFLVAYHHLEFPRRLKNELVEFNTLRNYIAHGFIYQTTYLVSPDKENENAYNVLDVENNIDWRKRFPVTRFNLLHELKYEDAFTALKIIVDVFAFLSRMTEHTYAVTIMKEKIQFAMIKADSTVEEVLAAFE